MFKRLKSKIRKSISDYIASMGFCNENQVLIDYTSVEGYGYRLQVGERSTLTNTQFNTHSGTIVVGNDTHFGKNCMVLTGQHIFRNGKLARLGLHNETPVEGNDIVIGNGCFIDSGAIIIKNVTIGDNVLDDDCT